MRQGQRSPSLSIPLYTWEVNPGREMGSRPSHFPRETGTGGSSLRESPELSSQVWNIASYASGS